MNRNTHHHWLSDARGSMVIVMNRALKLNHLDLHVHDVPRAAAFFGRHFGLLPQTKPDSEAIAILTDGTGFVLVLQRCPLEERYPDGFHLGFLVDDIESVTRLQAAARADGADVSDVIVNGRGTMIYFTAPEGYRVEVSCQRRRYE